jgi:hypothetical protein
MVNYGNSNSINFLCLGAPAFDLAAQALKAHPVIVGMDDNALGYDPSFALVFWQTPTALLVSKNIFVCCVLKLPPILRCPPSPSPKVFLKLED